MSKTMRLILITIVIGICSGIGGMCLSLLLRMVQHISYGYSLNQVVGNETFYQGVKAASPYRRFIVLFICGLLAGFGWFLLRRYQAAIVSVPVAVSDNKRLPTFTTIINAILQIVTIALGSPLGREAAPREIGALFAQRWVRLLKLTKKETKLLLACGAGAGLAAVYNVPLAGALFTMEVLLGTIALEAFIPAMATACIAVIVAWIGLGNRPQYQITGYVLNNTLIWWSIIMGPLLGMVACYFRQMMERARQLAPKTEVIIPFCILNFACIGLLAAAFPAILGNGKSPVQLEFDDAIGIVMTLSLFILRWLITWTSLRSGAIGGLLTPSLACGVLLAVMLGTLWNLIFPPATLNAYAIIGGTAFLATAQRMPLTAIALIFEFTRVPFVFIVPILFAVMLALGTQRLCSRA